MSADRYIWTPDQVKVVSDVEKHATHDQDDHGNWSRGRATPTAQGVDQQVAHDFIDAGDDIPAGSGLLYDDDRLNAVRGKVKHAIATDVGTRLEQDPRWPGGSGYKQVNAMNKMWASMVTRPMQEAAIAEFDLKGARPSEGAGAAYDESEVSDMSEALGDGPIGGSGYMDQGRLRPALRAMYEHTQDRLRKAGIEQVTLYRGVADETLPRRSTVPFRSQPISSWTSERSIAEDFSGQSGRILVATFPRERILSTARTGLGSLPEYEWTVLSGEGEVRVE